MVDTKPLRPRADDRYRTVEEAAIVELLLLCGWAFDVRRDARTPAEREARAALDRWTTLGLAFAQSPAGRRFDPAEVVNFLKWAGIHQLDTFWEERFIANGRRLVREFHDTSGGSTVPPSPATLSPERFAVTLTREFDLRRLEAGGRIVLRLPRPIEDEALQDLAVVAFAPPDLDVEFGAAPGRIDARLAVPRTGTVTLGVRATFIARAHAPGHASAPLSLPQDEVDLYTRPREGIAVVSPRIGALAATLASDTCDPWTVVRRFWGFLIDEFTIGVIRYNELDTAHPTDHVLETGWFDCQLGSALIVALCRARGIPARVVGGYLLYPVSPSQHYWAEVWLAQRGWVPLDSISSDLSARGRDIGWRDYFLGALDYRMKTQCLPRIFNRSPNVTLPPAWHMLARADGDATQIGLYASDTGALVYRDRIGVHRGAGSSEAASPPGGLVPSVNAGPL